MYSWPSKEAKLSMLAEVMKQLGHRETGLTNIYPVLKHMSWRTLGFSGDLGTMLGSEVK